MRRLLLVAICAAACARNVRPDRAAPTGSAAPSEAPRPAPRRLVGEGMASYYGLGFRGHLTANGERFDPDGRTAAHRTLPFGTCLYVENVANGRGVRVRVNDRGPYAAGRVLDLSEGAARQLRMTSQGVARVRLYAC